MAQNRHKEIQSTKLFRPPAAPDVVDREALGNKLEAGARLPLTVVLAPAGYGKSTAVSQWLDGRNAPVAWLSLDDRDSDTRLFLAYFIEALRTVAPGICEGTLRSLQTNAVPSVDVLANRLSNELGDLEERTILVLDDYHSVHDPEITTLIDRLLLHPHPLLHLIVISRRDPSLSLVSLRAKNALMELRMTDLAFSAEETLCFFEKTLGEPIETNEVQRLLERVEGWPAGIRLVSLALQGRVDFKQLLERFETNTQSLRDYLVAEVLSGLPPTTRDCLLKVSILDRFNARLVDALCGPENKENSAQTGEKFIQWLTLSGLFIIPLGGEPPWFRFHHLFGDMLQFQLKQSAGETETRTLHGRAGRWFTDAGYPEDAIRHSLAAGDVGAAVSIVADGRHELMDLDQWSRLEHWLKLFSEEDVYRSPQLLALRCWLELSYWYHLDTLPGDLQRLESLIDDGKVQGDEAKALTIEAGVMHAGLCYLDRDAVNAGKLTEDALRDPAPDRHYVKSVALMFRAGSFQLVGETGQAISMLQDHLAKPGFDQPGCQARTLQAMCFIHWGDAESRKLNQAANRLLEISKAHRISWSHSFARYFLGLLAYEEGRLDEGIEHLRLIADDPHVYPMQNVVHCTLTLGLCYQAKGDPEAARRCADAVSDLTLKRGNQPFMRLADAFQAELDLRQGFVARARRWALDYERTSLDLLTRAFNPEMTLARTLLTADSGQQRETAYSFLDELYESLRRSRHRRLLIDVLTLKAVQAWMTGERDRAEKGLMEALSLARPGRLLRPILDQGPEIPRMLNALQLDEGGEQFVGRIFAAAQFASSSGDPALVKTELPEQLSQRELEILGLLAEDLSNREIADRLFISTGTVKRHAHNIYGKLAVSDRRSAVGKATRLGILVAD